jgi:Zn-dependent peptidase ImmA (M78 family)
MSGLRWERLAGDTSVFALRLSFSADPDQGRGEDPDVAASWGAFSLWARGINLTAHADSGNTFESVSWYLLPLLEWIVASWDALLHEERLPCRVAADDAAQSLAATAFAPPTASPSWESDWQIWWRRHALQAARHGGPYPDVVLRRWRDEVEISWRNRVPAGVPVSLEFLAASGVERFAPSEVAEPLFEVTEQACAYLLKLRPDSARVKKLSAAVAELAGPVRRVSRLAWLAGLARTADAAAARWRDLVTTATSQSVAAFFDVAEASPLVIHGSCHGTLLFGSASPSLGEDDVLRIASAMAEAAVAGPPVAGIEALAGPQPVRPGAAAWTQGYDLAERIREELGLGDDELPAEMARVLTNLGVDVERVGFADKGIRAVSFGGVGLRPTTLVNASTHPAGREARLRFTLAHELCHLLVDRDKGARLAIVSGPWAPLDVERRANAFAAAFLMPEGAVASAVARASGAVDDLDEVVKIAAKLRASVTATIERLHDLGYVDDAQQERLKDSLTFGG